MVCLKGFREILVRSSCMWSYQGMLEARKIEAGGNSAVVKGI